MAQNTTPNGGAKYYNRDIILSNASFFGGAYGDTLIINADGSLTPPTLAVKSKTAGGVGYGTGAGGAVTQGTSRTTDVTLDAYCGQITLFSAAGSATPATFAVNNSLVSATDTIIVCQKSGTDLYHTLVTGVADGIFDVTFFTTGGTTAEQPVFTFSVVKSVGA